jgi:hypothetical protein
VALLPMTLLEDFSDFTLWHDATCACLYATWQGAHAPARTQAQYTLLREHVLATGSRKLLNDGLLDEDGWEQVANWIATQGFRIEAVAWVLPRHPAAFFDTARVLAQVSHPLVDTFTDAQAAYDWLHRWPQESPAAPWQQGVGSVGAFLLLPPAEQVALAAAQGRALAPRGEGEYYIKPYELGSGLRVEVIYHLHSGVLYQVQVQRPSSQAPAWPTLPHE